jgi:hypothetical protein
VKNPILKFSQDNNNKVTIKNLHKICNNKTLNKQLQINSIINLPDTKVKTKMNMMKIGLITLENL